MSATHPNESDRRTFRVGYALDLAPKPVNLKPSCQEVYEALGRIVGPADTTDIRDMLANYGITRERSNLSKRLCEMESLGLVVRVGHSTRQGAPTTWRRT